MELWRATDTPDDFGPYTYWTESLEDAEAYMEAGVGHGGPILLHVVIASLGDVLEVDSPRDVAKAVEPYLCWVGYGPHRYLAKASEFDADDDTEAVTVDELLDIYDPVYPYNMWEDTPSVIFDVLADNWDWIVYEDDYPEGCVTWFSLRGIEPQ